VADDATARQATASLRGRAELTTTASAAASLRTAERVLHALSRARAEPTAALILVRR
jgi:hypothetical protein